MYLMGRTIDLKIIVVKSMGRTLSSKEIEIF